MGKLVRGSWIYLTSFILAVVLSWLGGGGIALTALRQAQQPTPPVNCNLKLVLMQGGIGLAAGLIPGPLPELPGQALPAADLVPNPQTWGTEANNGTAGIRVDNQVTMLLAPNSLFNYSISGMIKWITPFGNTLEVDGALHPAKKSAPGPTTDTIRSADVVNEQSLEQLLTNLQDVDAQVTSFTYSYSAILECKKLPPPPPPEVKGKTSGITLDSPTDFETTTVDTSFTPP